MIHTCSQEWELPTGHGITEDESAWEGNGRGRDYLLWMVREVFTDYMVFELRYG